MVKCVKVYLVYKDGQPLPYKDFCRAAWDIQRQVRTAKNVAVSEYYESLKWKVSQKEQTDVYPDEVGRYGQKFNKYIYKLLCRKAPDLQTGNIATIQQSLSGKFKKDTRAILKGEKSIPSFKADQPIDLHNKSIRLSDCVDHIEVSISLFSTVKRQELGLKDGVVAFSVFRLGESAEAILKRCATGQYKHGAGILQYDRKKRMWFLSLAYHFEVEKHELDPNRICGVDLGIAAPIYCAVSDGYDRLSFPGGKLERFRRQVERRRRGILKLCPFVGKGAKGHGYKRRVRPVEVTSGKIARFRDTQNHTISRAVVDFAVKHQCGTIQMEDLSGIGELSTFLKNWPYYDLQMKIEQKAAEAGISVVKVNPQYTSQRCHKCGHISSDNRKSQADFVCVNCGYEGNADYNAAKNLSVSGIDKIIQAELCANRKQTDIP